MKLIVYTISVLNNISDKLYFKMIRSVIKTIDLHRYESYSLIKQQVYKKENDPLFVVNK